MWICEYKVRAAGVPLVNGQARALLSTCGAVWWFLGVERGSQWRALVSLVGAHDECWMSDFLADFSDDE